MTGLTPIALLLALQPMPPLPPEIVHQAVRVVQSLFVTIAVIALGIPLMRAFARRFIDRPPVTPVLAANVENRLERIEQAVEAMAIEVERISESQRYLTKLMTEPRAIAGGGAPTAGRPDNIR